MSIPKAKPTDGSFAFTTAATVLGVIALAQVAAVVWFVTTFEPEKQAVTAVSDSSSLALSAAATGGDGEGGGQAVVAAESPRISRSHSIANIPTVDPASVTPPAAEDDDVEQEVAVQNKAALFYLDQGMALRNDGDMQGALVHFNSAASLEKDHPRILYEFATTYEEMGLTVKATNYWKSIYQLGPVRGGDYFSLADFRLKGQGPAASEAEAEAKAEAGAADADVNAGAGVPGAADLPDTVAATSPGKKVLEIASAIAEPDDTVAEGQRVVLNVLIKASHQMTINPEYVHVRVDFYDTVNEDMVDLTRAVPANRWVTQPIDWRDQSEELLEVTYFLPPQEDQEVLDFGHRAYHGYVVKIYYHDQLQDAAAEPPTLLDSVNFGSPLANPTPPIDESFFPR